MFNSRFFSQKFSNLLHDSKYLLNVRWMWVCKLLLLLGDYFSNEFWNFKVLISWPFCLEFKYSLFQILLDILARQSSGKFQGLHIFSSTNHYVTFISNFGLYFPWFTNVDIFSLCLLTSWCVISKENKQFVGLRQIITITANRKN